MKELKRFRTGLIPGEPSNEPVPLYKGKVWHVTFELYKVQKKYYSSQPETVIYAKSCEIAQRALNLIVSSLFLFKGHPPPLPMEFIVFNDDVLRDLDEFTRATIEGHRVTTPYVPVACSLAAKASFRRAYVYAISKYNFSISLYSNFVVDLEPFRAPHIPISYHQDDHVTFCHCIISAYSAIEDLGLEVRASSKKPSMINGKWNPDVKEELENRLHSAGINLSETLVWILRGPRRKIEIAKPLRIKDKAPWSIGSVRDANVEVVDAIAFTSWLRSFVASHKMKDISRVISPYDIENVQSLARRLILETLGFWRWDDSNK